MIEGQTTIGGPRGTWDEASGPDAQRLVRRYEAVWREAEARRRRPDPADFLASIGELSSAAGVRLAVLRADLALRWEAGERVGVEWYRRRLGAMDDETLVALVYEEYCLREELDGSADPDSFYERFPEVADRLRRVLDIHGLVGSETASATATRSPAPGDSPATPFPEAGQTIGGFHLVSELGRGAFARVYLAWERQLADRPVALKVTRSGSREPQTLARLQHTYIVPVYSYRTDPATNLHLLCMPYFGHVTLAHLLADPQARDARDGAELLATLDRLDPEGAAGLAGSGTPARRALTVRPFVRSVAWWGACLAEALQHAHERGVLHRDIKPSNVLLTADGLPMLLDFNLAQERLPEGAEEVVTGLGGTLAYMAPEHLEALADGTTKGVDARSDLFALGVMLYEAMGSRPFPPMKSARTPAEAVLRMAEQRRRGAPALRSVHPEVSPDFEAVVHKCLAPDPADRYQTAAELAADLRAVADDGALRHAREPQPSRSLRWFRRNRRLLAGVAAALLAVSAMIWGVGESRLSRERLRGEIDIEMERGKAAEKVDNLDVAAAHFQTAERLASKDRALDLLRNTAKNLRLNADEARRTRGDVEALFKASDRLRFGLMLGLGGDLTSASNELQNLLAPFHVLDNPAWPKIATMAYPRLDPKQRGPMIHEVEELLYLWAYALDGSGDPGSMAFAVALCDRARGFARRQGPWLALRARLAARVQGKPLRPALAPDPSSEDSAWVCLQWALLRMMEDRKHPVRALPWLKRAVHQAPGDFWSQYTLAVVQRVSGNREEALRAYHAAVALRDKSPWPYRDRARLRWDLGDKTGALDDVGLALGKAQRLDFIAAARLDQGVYLQGLGDLRDARVAYQSVVASPDANETHRRAARLNLATLDAQAGQADRALGEFSRLLAEAPSSGQPDEVRLRCLLGRALLELRRGHPDRAESDLSELLSTAPDDPEALRNRALARLELNRPADAEVDAARALRLERRPFQRRLHDRTLLALGRVAEIRFDHPDDPAHLPGGRATLAADLRATADRLAKSGGDAATRAMILAALGDRAGAEVEARRLVEARPQSARSWLTEARLRHSWHDRAGALADLERGLALEPDHARLIELRGQIRVESGDLARGLADLDRGLAEAATVEAYSARAEALQGLGRFRSAFEDWSRALKIDPEDAEAHLGRARALAALGSWDSALADLEAAAALCGDRPDQLGRLLRAYARVLPARPERLDRVLELARQVWSAAQTPARRTQAPAKGA